MTASLPKISLRTRHAPVGAEIEFTFDDQPVTARLGESVAMALWASGFLTLRKSPRVGALRGVFCAMGVCQECVVLIGDRRVPACQAQVQAGLVVHSVQTVDPSPECHD